MRHFDAVNKLRSRCRAACGLGVALLAAAAGVAADFTVTSPGFFYSINGVANNPTLTLMRGKTYTFAISTSAVHPFEILDAQAQDTLGTNVINNNISSGTITFVVPTNAVTYTYRCSIHFFGGTIQTVAPPPPPTIRIVNLAVGTNLVLTSTGTNNWSLFPEFTTNLGAPNWFQLQVQTNRFANGTNETWCGRPPGDQVFIRIRAQSN